MRLVEVDEVKRTFRKYGSTEDFEPIMDSIPVIDPVNHGHIIWKARRTGGYEYKYVKCRNCGTTESIEIRHPLNEEVPYCSECGKQLSSRAMEYCPSCGTKMDREEEHVKTSKPTP